MRVGVDLDAVPAGKLKVQCAVVGAPGFGADRTGQVQQRSVVGGPVEDRDVFGAFTEGRYTEVQALFYRGGRLLGGKSHSFEAHDLPLGEVLGSFLLQFYDTAAVIPRGQLWVNPDCGLKTRQWKEVEPALRNMVEAARKSRA